jgi:hypothetical protein
MLPPLPSLRAYRTLKVLLEVCHGMFWIEHSPIVAKPLIRRSSRHLKEEI